MCGIAGIVAPSRADAEPALRHLVDAQRHRGPDGEGTESIVLPHAHLVLGHRRLAILDLTPAAAQPMRHPATGDWIVYNGEVYNFRELRRELQAAGERFQSHGDTEVVLAAYARWGTECFARLDGMFAIALYDPRAGRLVLARDPLGIKPLYLARGRSSLGFASELKALDACPLFSGGPDRRALAGLLAYGAVPEPLTLVEGVELLEPGTWASLDLLGPEPWAAPAERGRFWSFPRRLDQAGGDALRSEVHRRLHEAVRSHLLADVPVGVLLSSGLDSTTVAALARDDGGNRPRAFTVALAEHPELDEGETASAVAHRLGLEYHAVTLSEDDLRRQTSGFLDAVDQPTVDGFNVYVISRAIRERGIVVALSGLGGDELFAGYGTFRDVPRLLRWHRLTRWIPPALRRRAAALAFSGRSPARRWKAMELASRPRGLRGFCLRRRRLFSDAELALFGLDPQALGLDDDVLPPGREAPDESDPVAAVSVLESAFYMRHLLLRDADVFGMAHGVEIRVPLLDRRLAELVLSLPGTVRTTGRPPKPLLASVLDPELRGLLPLKKRGFHLPIERWMRGPLRETVAAALSALRGSDLLEPAAVVAAERAFEEHPDGPDWSRVWLLCVLGHWLRRRAEWRPRSDA